MFFSFFKYDISVLRFTLSLVDFILAILVTSRCPDDSHCEPLTQAQKGFGFIQADGMEDATWPTGSVERASQHFLWTCNTDPHISHIAELFHSRIPCQIFVHMKGCIGWELAVCANGAFLKNITSVYMPGTLPNAGDIVKFDMEPSPTKPGQSRQLQLVQLRLDIFQHPLGVENRRLSPRYQAKNVTGGTAPMSQPGMGFSELKRGISNITRYKSCSLSFRCYIIPDG